jgi:hypothetical protein
VTGAWTFDGKDRLLKGVGAPARPGAATPFPGAKPLELACLRERRTPTRAELETVVRALIDVAGGDDRLSFRRVEDLYLRRSGDPLGNALKVTTWVRPDRTMRTLLEYASGESEERVLFKGDEFVSSRGLPLANAIGASKQYVEWDWEVAQLPRWLALAAGLDPLPPKTEVDETTKRERVLIGMHVEVDGWNPTFDCWVDPTGPMIVAVEAELPLTGDLVAGSTRRQRMEFSDFRRVDGRLFAFRRDLHLGDARFGLAEAREIETGQNFGDEVFLPAGRPPPRTPSVPRGKGAGREDAPAPAPPPAKDGDAEKRSDGGPPR